jgi:hypothetical protein
VNKEYYQYNVYLLGIKMKSSSIMALTNVIRSFVEFHPAVNLMPREKERQKNHIT